MRHVFNSTSCPRQQGSSLLLVTFAMVVICGFMSFIVDLGRIQMAKTQLQRTADAVARAAASQIAKRDIDLIRQTAIAYALLNPVAGAPLNLNPSGDLTPGYDSDLVYGFWNTQSRIFTPLYGFDVYRANAVRVTARKRGSDAIPLMFTSVLGKQYQEVQAIAIATLAGGEAQLDVHGTSNPWFSGMPEGTEGSGGPDGDPDYHGGNTASMINQSVSGIYVYGGAQMTFEVTGGTTNDKVTKPAHTINWGPDGQLDKRFFEMETTNGISYIKAPQNALIGVFLTDERPDVFASNNPDKVQINVAQCPTDYSTWGNRNRLVYRPALQQVFFIGDGLTTSGQRQTFIAPPGATRLFLGSMDEWEWNNNDGSFRVQVRSPERIVLVR